MLDSFYLASYETCKACLLGKMTEAPFTGNSERATEVLELIHNNLCGPMNNQTKRAFQYFITFIDDFNRYG